MKTPSPPTWLKNHTPVAAGTPVAVGPPKVSLADNPIADSELNRIYASARKRGISIDAAAERYFQAIGPRNVYLVEESITNNELSEIYAFARKKGITAATAVTELHFQKVSAEHGVPVVFNAKELTQKASAVQAQASRSNGWFNVFFKRPALATTALAMGGLAMALTACLPAIGPTPQTGAPPTLAPEVIEPIVTPEPSPIPRDELLSYETSPVFDIENGSRTVSFTLSLDAKVNSFSVGDNEITLNSDNANTKSSLGNIALPVGEHNVAVNYTFQGNDFSADYVVDVPTESVNAYNTRLDSFLENIVSDVVITPAQLDVLEEQLRMFVQGTGLASQGEGFSSAVEDLKGYLEQDAEEVKRAVIAANTLLESDTSATPTLNDVVFMLDIYQEHRTNNVKAVTDTVTGEVNNFAFSDPTSFNSVFDMIVLLNYIATPEDAVDERVTWIFNDTIDGEGVVIGSGVGNGLNKIERTDYEGFDRRTLLENDVDARTVAIAIADILAFNALPLSGLSALPDWVSAVPKEVRLNDAAYERRPFALNVSDRPELSGTPPVPFFTEQETYIDAVGALRSGETITYLKKVGELIKYFGQNIDYVPTRTAPILEALARGNLDETTLRASFKAEVLPLPLFSTNREVYTGSNRVLFDFPGEAVVTMDDAMARRGLIAELDVETRGFTLRTNHLPFIDSNTTFDKEELFMRSKASGLGTEGAFRALGGRNVYNGDHLYFYPEESETLLFAGGKNWRIIGYNLRANRESYGMLWITPEAVAKAPPAITTPVIANFGNNQGVTAGEPLIIPYGVQLQKETELPFPKGPPYVYPPFPNADTVSIPQYPFFDPEKSAIYLESPDYAGGIYQKNFLTVPAMLDEGWNKHPQYANDPRSQSRGPHEIILNNTDNIPDVVTLIEREATRLGLTEYPQPNAFTPSLSTEKIYADAITAYFPRFSDN